VNGCTGRHPGQDVCQIEPPRSFDPHHESTRGCISQRSKSLRKTSCQRPKDSSEVLDPDTPNREAVLRRGQGAGRRRPAPPLAACRPHRRRMRAALRVPRECRPSSPPRLPRSRQRTGRHGLPPCGRPLHGGGSRCAPQARAAIHPRHPRGGRAGRPRAPALAPGRVAGTGRK